jgi:hypothetical protein
MTSEAATSAAHVPSCSEVKPVVSDVTTSAVAAGDKGK